MTLLRWLPIVLLAVILTAVALYTIWLIATTKHRRR